MTKLFDIIKKLCARGGEHKMPLKQLEKELFYKSIQRYDDGFVVLHFFADWCAPCKKLDQTLEQLADEYTNLTIYKVDVDQQKELAQKCEILAVPTVISFKYGLEYKRAMGSLDRLALLEALT